MNKKYLDNLVHIFGLTPALSKGEGEKVVE
jgi:hypothetical protein